MVTVTLSYDTPKAIGRALGFAFGLFLVLFVLGALWNRIKWIVLQKRNARKKHSTQPRTVINSKKS